MVIHYDQSMSLLVCRRRLGLTTDGGRVEEAGDLVSSDGREPMRDNRLDMDRGTRLRAVAGPPLPPDASVGLLPSRLPGRK
jgi:hypothetical protein